jgi:hypothetical protein
VDFGKVSNVFCKWSFLETAMNHIAVGINEQYIMQFPLNFFGERWSLKYRQFNTKIIEFGSFKLNFK